MTSLPFKGLNLPKKLGGEPDFSSKAFIARVTPEAQLHVTHSRFQGSPENGQLFFVQVKHCHHSRLCDLCPTTLFLAFRLDGIASQASLPNNDEIRSPPRG
jgi:hypothetical protein